MTIHRSTWEVIALFIASLIIFTCGLSSAEIVGFESRFFLFAKEMWQSGINWFPTTYFQPYPDYPVTSTLLIYFTAKLFGTLNKLTAVMPTAIAASMTVVFTYLIGALHSKRYGFYALCLLILTVSFLKDARSITLDMYTTLFTTWCFYLIYSADKKNSCGAWWVFPLIVLSFAFRGPIGLVIPTGVICTYYLLDKNIKKLFLFGSLALVLLIACTAGLLAIAHHVGGDKFMTDVLHMEVMGRMDGNRLPFYFYFTDAIGKYALSYPLAWLVMFGVIFYRGYAKEFVPESEFLFKLFGWMLIILIGMSIPGDKKIRYVLPMVPAAALMAAYPFAVMSNKKYFDFIAWIMQKFFLIFPILCILVTEVVFYYGNHYDLSFDFPFLPVLVFLIAMQVLSFWQHYHHPEKPLLRGKLNILIAVISFVVLQIWVIESIERYVDRAAKFVAAIEKLRTEEHASLVFYKEKSDGLAIKYVVNMPHEEKPEFIDDQNQLLNYKTPAFFVTKVERFEELPHAVQDKFYLVGNDTIGHIRIVVFKNTKKE